MDSWLAPKFGALAKIICKVLGVCTYAHFPSSVVFIRFSKGSIAGKEAKTAGLDRVFGGWGAKGALFIFVSQYLCHSALHTVGTPRFDILINYQNGYVL